MASNGLIFRAGRGPSCILVGLAVMVIILFYSYWGVSSKNSKLLRDVSVLEDRLRVLAARKLTSDKKNTALSNQLTELQTEKGKIEGAIKSKDSQIDDAQNQLEMKEKELLRLHDQEKSYQRELERLKMGVNDSSSELKALSMKAERLLKKFNEMKANHSALLKRIDQITAERDICERDLKLMKSQLDEAKKVQDTKMDSNKTKSRSKVAGPTDKDEKEDKKESSEVQQREEEVSEKNDQVSKQKDEEEKEEGEKETDQRSKPSVERDVQNSAYRNTIWTHLASDSTKISKDNKTHGDQTVSEAVHEPKPTTQNMAGKSESHSKQDVGEEEEEQEQESDDQENVKGKEEDDKGMTNDEEGRNSDDALGNEKRAQRNTNLHSPLDEGVLMRAHPKALPKEVHQGGQVTGRESLQAVNDLNKPEGARVSRNARGWYDLKQNTKDLYEGNDVN